MGIDVDVDVIGEVDEGVDVVEETDEIEDDRGVEYACGVGGEDGMVCSRVDL